MEAEGKCVKCLIEEKELDDECLKCIIARELNLMEISEPSNEQISEQTEKNETLAAVSVAVNEPQVEQTARQVSRANEIVVVVITLPPEYPNTFKQEQITTVNLSYFGVCPTSEGICESQSVAVQDQITDSTVESAVSVSRSEPEPSTSGYSGQKRKRNATTDSAEVKKNSRAKKRKANESQDKKRYWEGVCQVCNDSRKHGNIYTHLSTHEKRARKSKDQNEKNYIHKIEKKNGVKTLVRVPKTDGHMKKAVRIFKCDICAHYSSFRKDRLEDHIVSKHSPPLEKIIPCHLCTKLFATEENLRRHVNDCHAITWECRDCNQRMTYNQKTKHKHPVKPNWKKI